MRTGWPATGFWGSMRMRTLTPGASACHELAAGRWPGGFGMDLKNSGAWAVVVVVVGPGVLAAGGRVVGDVAALVVGGAGATVVGLTGAGGGTAAGGVGTVGTG